MFHTCYVLYGLLSFFYGPSVLFVPTEPVLHLGYHPDAGMYIYSLITFSSSAFHGSVVIDLRLRRVL